MCSSTRLSKADRRPGGAFDLSPFPQLNGGKKGGFFQVLIGAVLVATSFALGPVALILPLILMKIGIAMVLGGILQMFDTPKRHQQDRVEKTSHYLGKPENTVAIGTRIALKPRLLRSCISLRLIGKPSNEYLKV